MLDAEIRENAFYDDAYYAMQRDVGAFSAIIDRFKFEGEIRPTDRVLDFGCGGGFILASLPAREKIGIEINEAAARDARSKGLQIVDRLERVEDGWADVVISHHALEHVDHPLDVLLDMRRKLRPGGKIVLVTPNESVAMRYSDDDINFHLFTWSPSNLGNLLKRAGFRDISAEPVYHRWPPYWYVLNRVLPIGIMHGLCVARGWLRSHYCQVKAVAYKPVTDTPPIGASAPVSVPANRR